MSNNVSNASTGFDRFRLHKALVRGVSTAGFENPRPIQLETIPAGLDGRDVLGLAQTGTGKTAAFALPLLDRILTKPGKGPRALILAPTRELASQISEEIRTLSKFTRIKMVTVYGGVPIHKHISLLRSRPEIVVGCPGRVLDLIKRGVLRLGQVETLVLDEADHMFDMGFLPDIRRILGALPERRQNLLFSATMPKEIRKLANDVLHKPHIVELAKPGPAETIDHGLYLVNEKKKRDLLEHILNGDDYRSAIIFTRTKHRARRLADQLTKVGHRAVGLQGNMSQVQRDRAMKGFRGRRFDILVATDIASRGIDVSGVSHVINYDVPNTPDAYTHRIGRTGRSEKEGIACTFVTASDHDWVRSTERMIGSPIPRREVEGFDHEVEEKPRQGRPQRRNGHSSNRSSSRSGNRSNSRTPSRSNSGGGRANGRPGSLQKRRRRQRS